MQHTYLIQPHKVLPTHGGLHLERVEELSGLDALEDGPDVGTSITHALLFSAHHYLAEVSVDDDGAESLELPNQLQEHLLHQLVDHTTQGRLIQEGGGRADPPDRRGRERGGEGVRQ